MSSVKLTRTDLKVIEKNNAELTTVDKSLIEARKQSIFSTLKAASDARTQHLLKMQSWIETVEKKIFNPFFIEELSADKTIALFKYINNLNLKALAESGKLEAVLNNYIQSGALEMSAELKSTNVQNNTKADISKLKGEIMSKLSSILHSNTSDAVIVNKEDDNELEEDLKHMQKDLENTVDIVQENTEEKTIDDEMKNLDMELDNLDI